MEASRCVRGGVQSSSLRFQAREKLVLLPRARLYKKFMASTRVGTVSACRRNAEFEAVEITCFFAIHVLPVSGRFPLH